MKKFWKVASTLALATALAACGGEESSGGDSGADSGSDGGSSSQEKVLINMGSAPSSTSWYTYFTAASNAINNNQDAVETAVIEAGGTVVNAVNMANKEQDIGFTMSDIAYDSYNGLGQFESDNPSNPDLRMMWNISPTAMHWSVAEESGITLLEELDGQKFNPSSIGGGGEFITFRVFELLGIEPDYQRMKLDDAAEQVQNGQLVGFSYNGNPPIPKFTEVHSQKPLRILGLSDEQVDQILAEYPYFIPATIPEDAYPGSPEAQTLGLFTGVAANKEVPEEVVYEMTKAYWENIDDVITSFPALEGSTIEETLEVIEVPLHVGAARYYEEAGYEIPEHLIVD
jgi:TRAP transporter TAXI family solute receptor